LRISYPSEADRMRALEMGYHPGGQIMIHGLKNGQGSLGSRHLADDWTDGCIAVTNDEIDEIWSLVDLGTPVEIRP
jgi:murein L,D-transpeptidase YafK